MSLTHGTSNSITITAGSLASAANRSSAAVTTGQSQNIAQILLQVSILTTSSAPTGNKQVLVYGYASENSSEYCGASSIVDNVDGTDKALTAIGAPTNLYLIGRVNLNQGTNAVTIRQVFEVTQAFGFIPRKWGIVLYNDAGVSLGTTVTAEYCEVYYT